MADEDKNPKKEEAAPPPAKKGGKMMLIIGAVVGVLVLAGVPTVFLLMGNKAETKDATVVDENEGHVGAKEEGAGEEDELQENEESVGAIFPLETFVVNLTGGRYIRVQVQMEFDERDVPKRFYAKIIPIRDSIINLLIQKTEEDLLAPKGRDALRVEIKDLVNEVLKRQDVKHVYFTQFVVQ